MHDHLIASRVCFTSMQNQTEKVRWRSCVHQQTFCWSLWTIDLLWEKMINLVSLMKTKAFSVWGVFPLLFRSKAGLHSPLWHISLWNLFWVSNLCSCTAVYLFIVSGDTDVNIESKIFLPKSEVWDLRSQQNSISFHLNFVIHQKFINYTSMSSLVQPNLLITIKHMFITEYFQEHTTMDTCAMHHYYVDQCTFRSP